MINKTLNLDQLYAVVSKQCYPLRFPEKSTFIFIFLKNVQSEHLGFLRIQLLLQRTSINGIKMKQKHVRQNDNEKFLKYGVI